MSSKPARSVALLLLLLTACSPFAHLTRTDNEGRTPRGPKAAECGQCHVEQHQEWQASAHARAFSNPRFQAAMDGNEEDCLGCHAPDTVRTNDTPPHPRRYHREDGISCVACHLDKGAMTGPEEGSALMTPHPVRQDQAFFRDSTLCGRCHQETFVAWQASSRANPATPTCQECHMAQVSRTATKGTNPFSSALVAFETVHATRRHTFGIDHLAGAPGLIDMTLNDWQPETGKPLSLAVRNLLPHPLPAGVFRSRSIRVTVTLRGRNRALLATGGGAIGGDGGSALNPGETRTLAIPLAMTAESPSSLTAELLLGPLAEEGELTLARKEFPLPPPP